MHSKAVFYLTILVNKVVMHDGSFWGMHFIWWIVWLGFLIWIFLLPSGLPTNRRSEKNALDILKERFAKGEISKEEYEEKRKTLES